MSDSSHDRYFFLLLPDRDPPIMGLTPVEPQTWELTLLRDLDHAEEDTSIFRLTGSLDPEDIVAPPEKAERKRSVLRVLGNPEQDKKLLLTLVRIDFELPVFIEEENIMIGPDQVVMFRPASDEDLNFHVRTAGLDS